MLEPSRLLNPVWPTYLRMPEMQKGDFVWCDLSTISAKSTNSFYVESFGWTYGTKSQPDGSDYHIALTAKQASAGIFEIPEKFQKMGMTSFWMSYVALENIVETVGEARCLGGKVEMGPIPFSERASIALIRDPLGAGFTVYEGDRLEAQPCRCTRRSLGMERTLHLRC